MISRCRRGMLMRLIVFLAVLLCAAVAAGQTNVSVASNGLPCYRLTSFHSRNFPEEPSIDNRFLPLAPGTERVYEGVVDGVPHSVTFVTTDLVKEIDGVESLVIWDVDRSEGEVVESELAFFAQDNSGNVWNTGEYPEEFEDGEFAGAPSAWHSGFANAEAGVHMAASPTVGTQLYLQGFAPDIEFLDCAHVDATGQTVTAGGTVYSDVLATEETNPLAPDDGFQTKYYAPGVGIVKIGVSVPGTSTETLELVSFRQLNKDELHDARLEALHLDRRAHRFSEAYADSPLAKRLK